MGAYRLRLVKGLSYTGEVYAHKDNPDVLVDDKAVADRLAATGYFEYAQEGAAPSPKQKAEPTRLELMNLSELESYAAYHNIDIKGVKGRDKVVKAIKEAVGGELKPADSPTMQELQEKK